ncbi:MAG: glycosyltransferase family 25 protein [Betaproteobacteria bacterium]
MDAYYINLDSDEGRRQFIEKGFSDYNNQTGTLKRVPAIDINHVVSAAIPGKIRSGEKACILSHQRAIELSINDNNHSLIIEDDVQFGPNTFSLLSKLGTLLDDFDIVFTDLGLGDIHDMIRFFVRRRKMLSQGLFKLLDLKGIFFFGSTAYVINARSKEKLIGLIDGLPSLDLPYDIQLRQWIENGDIKAGLAFPFLTTVSSHADYSGIQLTDLQLTDAVCNAYRRIMWADFGHVPENPVELLSKLNASYFDTQSLYFAQILSVMLSPNFIEK